MWCSMGSLRMSGANIVYMNTQFSGRNSLVWIVAMKAKNRDAITVPDSSRRRHRNQSKWSMLAYFNHTHTCPALPNGSNFISCEKPTETYCIDAVPETRCRMNARMFQTTLTESDVQIDSYAKPEFGTDEVGDVMLIYVNGILVYQWRCHRSFCFHIQYRNSTLSLCVRKMYKIIDVLWPIYSVNHLFAHLKRIM